MWKHSIPLSWDFFLSIYTILFSLKLLSCIFPKEILENNDWCTTHMTNIENRETFVICMIHTTLLLKKYVFLQFCNQILYVSVFGKRFHRLQWICMIKNVYKYLAFYLSICKLLVALSDTNLEDKLYSTVNTAKY